MIGEEFEKAVEGLMQFLSPTQAKLIELSDKLALLQGRVNALEDAIANIEGGRAVEVEGAKK